MPGVGGAPGPKSPALIRCIRHCRTDLHIAALASSAGAGMPIPPVTPTPSRSTTYHSSTPCTQHPQARCRCADTPRNRRRRLTRCTHGRDRYLGRARFTAHERKCGRQDLAQTRPMCRRPQQHIGRHQPQFRDRPKPTSSTTQPRSTIASRLRLESASPTQPCKQAMRTRGPGRKTHVMCCDDNVLGRAENCR